MKKMLLMALCLLLAACMAVPAAMAESGAALSANMSEINLVKGGSVDVKLTYKLKGKIYAKWDNASAVDCELSGEWDGNETTMRVKGVGVGKATITLTDSESDDVLKIKVTVTDGKKAMNELRTLIGKTVSAANKTLPKALKAVGSGYDNGFFSVKRNSIKRIKSITLYGGSGAYRLFSVYPGMKYTAAVSTLNRQGWKRYRKSSKGDVYVSSSDLFCAIRLVKKSTKLDRIIYYIP